MKIFDRNFKLFGKIPVIDIIILTIIVCVAAVAVRFVFQKNSEQKNSVMNINVTVKLIKTQKGFENSVKPGDEIFDSKTKKPMGKVVKVRSTPFTQKAINEKTGVQSLVTVEGYSQIYIEYEAVANDGVSQLLIEGEKICIGNTVSYYSKNYNFSGSIYDIKEVSDENNR